MIPNSHERAGAGIDVFRDDQVSRLRFNALAWHHGLKGKLAMHEFWIPGSGCDMGYRNIRDLDKGPCTEIRTQLEAYWDQCKSFADENFREEFSLQPDPRFWELYLFHRLLNAGKALVARDDRPADGPDILIDDGESRLWIEAVTFGQGDDANPDRVPEMKYFRLDDDEPMVAQAVPVNEIELRISSVFMKKSEKFKKYAERGTVGADDFNLIAINPGKVSTQAGYDGRGSPLCVLYPLGDQYVTFYKDSTETSSGYHRRTEIEKSSGAQVPTGMFADEHHTHISGAIWSKTTLGNIIQGNNDLTLYPNSTPTHPLDSGWLDWGNEWRTSLDDDGQCTLTKVI